MTNKDLRAVRECRGWTQQQLAKHLGVSQTLVCLWERGARPLPTRRYTQFRTLGMQLDPTALPLRKDANVNVPQELANLGYPGFAHNQNGEPAHNPAQVLVTALADNQLDRRTAEALPWLVLRYSDMNWDWVCREAKSRDLQNRLGFTVRLGCRVAAQVQHWDAANRLSVVEQALHPSLLAKEDTYCNDRMTPSERQWLRQQRSEEAAAWNMLSDLKPEYLTHAA